MEGVNDGNRNTYKKFTKTREANSTRTSRKNRRWEQEKDRGPDGKAVTLLAEVLKTTPEYLLNDSSDDDISLSSTNEHSHNKGMAIFTSRNGERFEVPATPEGYAFLRDMAVSIANREVSPAMA